MNIIPPTSAHYQATLQQIRQGLRDGVDEYHDEIVKKKNAEAQAESDTPSDVTEAVNTYKLARQAALDATVQPVNVQPVTARVVADYFPLREDLQDRLADGLEQLDQVASQELLSRGQQILSLTQQRAIYERDADEAKQAAVAFLEGFKHDRTLTKFEIQVLIKVLKNPIGNYEATHRAKAAAILGQQPVLPTEVRLVLKEVIDHQNQDEWVKIQATIALSNYEPLPDEYIEILLNGIKHQTEQYEVMYRANAAVALCQQPILSQDVCSALEATLKDQDQGIQLKAAIALAGRGQLPEEAIQVLLEAVQNEDKYAAVERANAVYVLRQEAILPEKVRLILEAALAKQNQDQWVKVEIAITLASYAQLSEAQTAILLDTIENRQYPLAYRSDATCALGKLSVMPEQARLALKRSLKNDDKGIRLYAAAALARNGLFLDEAIPILVEAVGNQQYANWLRRDVVFALGEQPAALSSEARSTLKVALNDPNNQVKIHAAVALSNKGHFLDKVTSILVEAVANQQCTNWLRRSAVLRLGEQSAAPSQEVRSVLEAALNDSDSQVKIQTAAALARKGLFLDKVTPILVEAVGNQQYSNFLRRNAALRLAQQSAALSQEARSALEAALNDPDSQVKIRAALALANKGHFLDKVTPILVEAVGNQQYSNFLRRNAALRLGQQSAALSPEAESALEAALNDSDSEVKIQAAVALARKDRLPGKVTPILVEAVGNQQYANFLRGNAALWLGEQSVALSSEAESALEAALNDSDSQVGIQAAVALARKDRLPGKVTPILVEAVGNQQYANVLRSNAALRLGEQSAALSPEVESALEAALNDSDSEVKIQAAVALANKGHFLDKVTPILVEAVGNQQYSNFLRRNAALRLAQQSAALSPEAESALEAALNDSDSEVKIQAAVALARKGHFSDKVTSILVEAVGNQQYANWLRGNSAYALSLKPELLKTENVRSTLKAVLEDSDDRVRNYASKALKKYEQSQSWWPTFG